MSFVTRYNAVVFKKSTERKPGRLSIKRLANLKPIIYALAFSSFVLTS